MNGTNAVTTITDCLRFWKAEVITSGSGAGAAGTITLSIGGNTQGEIEATRTITNNSHITTPAGHTMLLHSAVFSVEKTDRIRFELEHRIAIMVKILERLITFSYFKAT